MHRDNVILGITRMLQELTNEQLEELHNELSDTTQVRYIEDDTFEITP